MLKQCSLLILLLLFAASVPAAIAQTIQGLVIDQKTEEPLQGATILETGTENGTSTDADGRFSLDLQSGSGQITVRYVGYQTATVSTNALDEPLTIALEPGVMMSGEVFVRALRVDDSTPVAYSNVDRTEIEKRNLGQDIPFLVNSMPSVVSTSDAGAGIGYTGIRIRGVDPGRINVTINGIPLNDSESHGVFWVNMPDIASSTQNIQIQRGVGTSTQGAGAFGGSMNLQTAIMNPDSYGEINAGTGSFGTQKYNVKLGTGIMENGWQFEGRLSKIVSDGYIDRASSDLKSFYLSGSRHGERSLLKADIFSGQEETYQAWNGVPEPILENNPDELNRYITTLFLDNELAAHLQENLGNRSFNEFTYDDQVDRYQQDHYQLHYSYRLADYWTANTSLHYTYGRGYFEEFRRNDDLSNYSIGPIQIGSETITESDLVRRRWLDNHFYGAVFSTEIDPSDRWTLTVGGGYNEYDGDHFGEVIWARFAGNSNIEESYYDNNGFKTDFNVYTKLNYYFTPRFNAYADVQYRAVTYRFVGLGVEDQTNEPVDVSQQDRIHFLNPKAGFVFRLSDEQRLFASLSVGGKEPTRSDYVDSSVESRPGEERLFDYEAGYTGNFGRIRTGLNLYYMQYKDQLILTGAVNDVGGYVRENVPDSYRAGIEFQAAVQISNQLNWNGNLTLSENKIREYIRYLDDYDQGGQQEQRYEDVNIAFSPSAISSSVLTYNLGNLTSEWLSKYVSRQYLDNTETQSRSIDPYWVNDLRFSYEFSDIPGARALTVSLQINNVLNETYSSNGYTFGYISGGEQNFNYYYPQAGRNFLMNLKVQF